MRILIVDNDANDRETMQRMLHYGLPGDVEVICTRDATGCLTQMRGRHPIACILLDHALPGRDGLSLLPDIFDIDPFVAVVMVTNTGSETIAAEAFKRGAQDYYIKQNLTPAGLERAVSTAVERAAMTRKIEEQQNNLRSFAHVLVHDLRAPLRSVRGGVSMLLEDLPGEVCDSHRDVLGFIRHGAERMDQLIVALYNFCSVEDLGEMTETIDLHALTNSVRSLLTADLQTAGAVFSADTGLPDIRGNTAQMMQLLQNLVANGIKYNVSARPMVHLSAEDHGDRWQIDVRDNGIGIDEEHLDEIFKPFRRLHRHEDYEGSGLGLATCQRIAERHGGRLICRSVPGKGTTFVLHLPKRALTVAAPQAEPALRAVGR